MFKVWTQKRGIMKPILIAIVSVFCLELFDRAGERAKEMSIAKLELAEVCIKIAYGSSDTLNARKLEEIAKELK